jgi:hypothetical protein
MLPLKSSALLISFLFILVLPVWCQTSAERQALNLLLKGKWEKSRSQLDKAIRKDSADVTAWYVYSIFYFTPSNPSFQIDSAYTYIEKALQGYPNLNTKVREKIRRFPLDSLIMINQRKAIDSAAFERAKALNTEQAYLYFISTFTHAEQLDRARELRDEVAFIDALKVNTYQSFLSYINRYPQASRIPEARERYEKLLYEAKTKDHRLASYKTFVEEYPQSPYRAQAEQQIFEIATASSGIASYLEFLQDYPSANMAGKARQLLYHIVKEEELPIPSFLQNDSIQHLQTLEEFYLVPFLKDGKFGFMDAHGKEVIPPASGDLEPGYLCGNIVEELLIADQSLIARNGSVIYKGAISSLDDLGYGFLLIEGDSCLDVIHKSGRVLAQCVDDARIISGSFLAVQDNGNWELKTFSGRTLPLGELEDVDAIEQVVIVKKSGQYQLTTVQDLANVLDAQPPAFSQPVDEVKRWNQNLIWIRTGTHQALWDLNLNEQVAYEHGSFQLFFNGSVIRTDSSFRLWNKRTGLSSYYQAIQIQKPWIAARSADRWQILDENFQPKGNHAFDSLYFSGPFMIGIRQDSLEVHVTNSFYVTLSLKTHFQFLPGKDSVYFLMLEEGDKKTVISHKGERLFTVAFDRLEYAGENLFLVTRREKRGLINLQGKPVVPPAYDAMGNVQSGSVAVLKDKKFGYLDLNSRKEIKPVYERNLVRYSDRFLIAHKKGHYGIIDWNNKPVTGFEFDEIRYWNDSTALVKRSIHWVLFNFIEKKVVADKIRDYKWLRDDATEKIIIVHQENNYGVVSNRRGFILQPTYSDIVNLGTSLHPFYFTEKHVEEASIYVVIYYDASGKLVHRQVYEVEDYERIYCSK